MKGIHIKRLKIAGFISIFLGALILRIYDINKYDLWFDELASNYYSYQNVSMLVKLGRTSILNVFMQYIACDPSSIFYYLVIYVYSFLFGAAKALRLLSVVFSVSSLVVLYKLARQFFDKKTSIYALLLMALSPMQIWYSQEARVYSMVSFLAISTVYFYVRALKTDKLLYLFLFMLSCISACYASYYSVFLFLPMGIMFICSKYKRNNTRWSIAVVMILLLIIPLLYTFKIQWTYIKDGFWVLPPSLRVTLSTFAVFVLGYSSTMWQICTAPVIFLSLYIYGAYSYYHDNRNNSIILSLFFLFPVTATYFISKHITPLYLYRQLLMYCPFYYMFIAKGILSIRNSALKKGVTLLIFTFMAISLINYYNNFILAFPESNKDFYPGIHLKKSYASLMHLIEERSKAGDAIVATDIQSFVILGAYFQGHIIQKNVISVGYLFYPYAAESCLGTKAMMQSLGMDTMALKTRKLTGWWLKERVEASVKEGLEFSNFSRVWIVSSAWHLRGDLNKNSKDIRNSMLSKHKKLLSKEKDGIYIDLFQVVSE